MKSTSVIVELGMLHVLSCASLVIKSDGIIIGSV